MLLIVTFLYVFHNTIAAAPISHVLRDASPPDPSLNPVGPCVCPDQQRSLWDILWNCLATIFACTWVSIHPNIPPPGEKWWKTGFRRLELMLWGVIAPELIILWAMRQWNGARKVAERYRGHGWTKTHGYFMQMGGFTLFERNSPTKVLLPNTMEELLLKGHLDLPEITEEDIYDRSKADGLSKALVIGQTSWFVAQCIARRAQGLVLTELELVTGAFAILNGVMYFLWWNKPLDVRCSVPIHLLAEPKPEEERFTFDESTEESSITHWPWDAIFHILAVTYSKSAELSTSTVTWFSKAKDINPKTLHKAVLTNLKTLLKPIVSVLTAPWTAIMTLYLRLHEIIDFQNTAFNQSLLTPNTNAGPILTVPTFYAYMHYAASTTGFVILPAASTVAAIFGSLHCAAWFFAFPSRAEMIIWRVSSTIISVVPISMLFLCLAFFGEIKTTSRLEVVFKALVMVFSVVSTTGLPVYAVARLILFGEAFAALRYLTPNALAVVDWLSFLPHI